MIELESVELDKYVFYKSARFNLNHPGITTVYGLNKDAGKESTNSNASGKSLLLTAIPDLRFEASSVPMESRQKASKDAYVKGTRVAINWVNGGKRFTGIKQQPGASIQYELMRDGVPAKNRTAAYFKSKLAELLPWSETEYFNLIHIDSRRNSNLQLGSPAARLQFFTELFKLDDIDTVRGLMKTHWDKHKQSAAVSAEIKSQIAAINEQRKGWTVSLTDLQEDYDQLENEIATVRARIKKNQALMQKAFDSKAAIDAWNKLDLPNGHDEVAGLITSYVKEQQALARSLMLLERWAEHKDQARKVKRKNAEANKVINEALTALGKSPAPDDVLLDDLSVERKALMAKAKQASKTADTFRTQLSNTHKHDKPDLDKSSLAWFKQNFDSVDDMDQQRAEARVEMSTQDHLIITTQKALDKFERLSDKSCCPSCTQELTSDIKEQVVASYKATLEKARTKFEKIRTWLKSTEKCWDYYTELDKYERWQEAVDKYQPSIDKYEKEIKEIGMRCALIDSVLDLMFKLEPMPAKPDKPEPDIDEGKSRVRLEKLDSMLSLLVTVQDYLEANGSLDNDLHYGTLEAKQTKLQQQLDNKLSSLPALKVELMQRLEVKQRHKNLTDRLADLGAEDHKGKWLEILYEAYGSKGIKTLLSKKLAKNLENNMNRNRGLLFREDITFEFVVDANEFSIFAHRKYKNRVVTSDVRRLSGAESRAFNFLLPLSLIPMIPSARRCNLLVLDEPTVNMDLAFKDNFLHKFIPALSKVVPSIIFITPNNEERIPGARVVRAVKQNGITTLEEK